MFIYSKKFPNLYPPPKKHLVERIRLCQVYVLSLVT